MIRKETDEKGRRRGIRWHRWRRRKGAVIPTYQIRRIEVHGQSSDRRCPPTIYLLKEREK
jgi:hypothetical protein